jgi:hypothetical protein
MLGLILVLLVGQTVWNPNVSEDERRAIIDREVKEACARCPRNSACLHHGAQVWYYRECSEHLDCPFANPCHLREGDEGERTSEGPVSHCRSPVKSIDLPEQDVFFLWPPDEVTRHSTQAVGTSGAPLADAIAGQEPPIGDCISREVSLAHSVYLGTGAPPARARQGDPRFEKVPGHIPSGSLKVSLRVSPDGGISNVTVETDASPALRACVQEAVARHWSLRSGLVSTPTLVTASWSVDPITLPCEDPKPLQR